MASPDVTKGLKIAAGAVTAAGLANYVYPYWANDIRTVRRIKGMTETATLDRKQKYFVVDLFLDQAKKHPYKTGLIFDNTAYTYGDIDNLSNKFANFVSRQGLKLGDTVAMMMYNEPAFLWMYLGFAKLGITCTFINYNLRGESINYCLQICGAKLMAVGREDELLHAVHGVSDRLAESKVDVWTCHGNTLGSFRDIQEELAQSPADPIPRDARSQLDATDVSVYIFTSGTTGLPKAVKYSYGRLMASCNILPPRAVKPGDRMYVSLPLYHSSGFIVGVGNCWKNGITVILAKKFSVHHFWEDCRRHGATIFLYIGEVCRYLLTLPETSQDKNHSIRVAWGNGLRRDIWDKFQKRFAIPTIAEFYGATEGGFFTMSMDNTPGVLGKFSPFLKRYLGFELVEYDFETATPLRNKDGRCIPVGLGNVGLLVSPVRGHYDGYSDKKLNNKRLLRNVFKDGDLYSNMGDLMLLDRNYRLHFVDRIGDTFRWKGENVSTTEVEKVIGVHPAVKYANVYGVNIPGQDGRAGMAAVVLKDDQNFNPKSFYDHVTASLPLYACPRFLRMTDTVDETGTHKFKKADLVKQGFDPNQVDDEMYYMDLASHTYKVFERASLFAHRGWKGKNVEITCDYQL